MFLKTEIGQAGGSRELGQREEKLALHRFGALILQPQKWSCYPFPLHHLTLHSKNPQIPLELSLQTLEGRSQQWVLREESMLVLGHMLPLGRVRAGHLLCPACSESRRCKQLVAVVLAWSSCITDMPVLWVLKLRLSILGCKQVLHHGKPYSIGKLTNSFIKDSAKRRVLWQHAAWPLLRSSESQSL